MQCSPMTIMLVKSASFPSIPKPMSESILLPKSSGRQQIGSEPKKSKIRMKWLPAETPESILEEQEEKFACRSAQGIEATDPDEYGPNTESYRAQWRKEAEDWEDIVIKPGEVCPPRPEPARDLLPEADWRFPKYTAQEGLDFDNAPPLQVLFCETDVAIHDMALGVNLLPPAN